jgi:hypothetical protein
MRIFGLRGHHLSWDWSKLFTDKILGPSLIIKSIYNMIVGGRNCRRGAQMLFWLLRQTIPATRLCQCKIVNAEDICPVGDLNKAQNLSN